MTSTDDPDRWFYNWATGGGETLSGISVTPDTAMRQSAVFTCVRNRSEDIGKIPCLLYRRLPGGGKERAVDHRLYTLIRDQPNPRQTAMEFKQMLQAQIDLRGNGLAIKEYNGRGEIVALWPVCWSRVTPLRTADGREMFYTVAPIGSEGRETYPAEGVVHLRGLTLDGYVGLSPIAYHRETIGLAIAAERYGAAFFGNSAQPRGAIKLPGVISPEAAEKLREDWETKHRGVARSSRLAILDASMDYVKTGMDNTDAQYIETRNLQGRDIFRIFRMPPHKAGDLERSTNNNIEHQSLEYVQDCLLSEAVRWEQTLRRDLLLEAEKQDYFFECLLDVLLRGDFKSRMDGYAIGRNWGLFSADDCREKENMNPLPNSKGKIYLQPMNMIEAGTKPPLPAPADPASAKALVAYLQLMIAHQEQSQ